MLQPDTPGSIATGTAVATLAVYAAVCIGVIAVVMSRRDVDDELRAEGQPSALENPRSRTPISVGARGRGSTTLEEVRTNPSPVMMRPRPGPASRTH